MGSKRDSTSISKEELETLYIHEKMSARKIGAKLGCSAHKVTALLREHGIPIRSNRRGDIEPALLEELYANQGKTSSEIAEELGCSPNFVVKQLHKHGIPTRAESKRSDIEALTEDVLYQEYVVDGLSSDAIAQKHNVSKRTVLLLLDKLGIPKRHRKKYRQLDELSTKDMQQMKSQFVVERTPLKHLASKYGIFANALSIFAEKEKWHDERHERELSLVSEAVSSDSRVSYSEIERETGLPRNVVRKCCEEIGYEREIRTIDDYDQKQILELYVTDKKSVQQVADKLGASYSLIYSFLRSRNAIRSADDLRAEIDADKLHQRYIVERASYAELCDEFNVSPITLNRLLKKNNIELLRSVQHEEEWKDFQAFVLRLHEERGRKINIVELAEYFDVTPAAVRSKIREDDLQEYVSLYRSHAEQEWETWLKSCGIKSENKNRSQISPQEIDLFLPDFNVGIEINPSATHNSDIDVYDDTRAPKESTYHQKKARLAETAGINLISVFDWYDKDKIRSIVLGLCHQNVRVFARNTELKAIQTSQEKNFLTKHHLQGYTPSKHAYGLFHEEELVAVMTFGAPRYSNKEHAQWELLRFCSKDGLTVVGGASKLFAAFVREHSPSSIMSFANLDISNGQLYETLGFSFMRYTAPAHQWVKLTDPSEHYSWQLVKQMGYDRIFGTNYGKGTSNSALMFEHGFVRVFDCGNKVYLWKSSSL